MDHESRISADTLMVSGWTWWRVLLSALGLYIAGVVILVLTQNPNLFPTVVMIGTFAVPVAYVVFLYERQHLSSLTAPAVALTFLYGGLLGVFAASILEPLLLHPIGRGMNISTAFGVGLIEEAVKIIGILWIARRLRHDSELDGIILGAAAGMGFAALESMGYAFTAFLDSGGSISATVGVTLFRGLLSPVGHGTWTAILTGALFQQSASGHFRFNGTVILAYLGVSGLHGLWDGLPLVIAAMFPSGVDVLLGQVAVGLSGLLILWWRWRTALRSWGGARGAENVG